MAEKIIHFDWILYELSKWADEKNVSDFKKSRIKAMKMFFFVSSLDAELLSLFDFYAFPYGHIEKDIFLNIEKTNYNTLLKPEIESQYYDIIINSIALLKTKNENLISLPPFKLVEISHLWQSWKLYFSIARYNGKNYEKINSDFILKEEKYFTL